MTGYVEETTQALLQTLERGVFRYDRTGQRYTLGMLIRVFRSALPQQTWPCAQPASRSGSGSRLRRRRLIRVG